MLRISQDLCLFAGIGFPTQSWKNKINCTENTLSSFVSQSVSMKQFVHIPYNSNNCTDLDVLLIVFRSSCCSFVNVFVDSISVRSLIICLRSDSSCPIEPSSSFFPPLDPDGLDAGISDLDQDQAFSELTHLQGPHSQDHWDDVLSTTTPCSQTREDKSMMANFTRRESTTPEKNDCAPTEIDLVADGTEVGKLIADDTQSYAGMDNWVLLLGR